MDVCINCKHHRKEGRAGIRCYAGVVEQIVRSPVTGVRATSRQGQPEQCEARRRVHPDECPDYVPALPVSVMDSEVAR
ncbi:hypothetical protein ACJBUE_20835 (plasmid) [Ralstonia syzygii subsp. celebesensis]|uniref:Uncharacterized protein n=1 Tax=blood disease bacterium R229 TaxID=741978 RepID=G2ZVY5_9RALS|nr:hypothetical protein [Ralstonia syzygii]QQV57843.1 hypothetical protein JK151_20680 [Ralstonia syzygii subsp. celebesensis]CCA83266.1 hypothetical protein BDB_mp60432 [blood disease bacterium R229]